MRWSMRESMRAAKARMFRLNITISLRLWMGFGLLCLFLIVMGWIALSSMGKVNVTTQDMINRVMPTVSKAQEMKLTATQLRVYEGDYIRAFPNPKADKIEADMKRIIEKLQTDVESYSSMANSEESKAATQKFDTDFMGYLQQHEQIIDSAKSKNAKGALLLYDEYSSRFYQNFQESLDKLIEVSQAETEASGRRNQAQYESGYTFILSAMAVIVIIAVLLSFTTIRSILKPIRSINLVLADLAEAKGDLSRRIDIRSGDEIQKMGNLLNKVLESIERMVMGIRMSTLEVSASAQDIQKKCTELHASSEEIAEGIMQLSESAQQQAEQSQQTQKQAHDYAARLDKVASYAHETYELAKQANAGTINGGQKLDEVMERMESIERQNMETCQSMERFGSLLLRINEMNAAIRGISAQTNMLALNAGIEAARAGMHGKGFSVVASEIGKLANAARSANEQIFALIDDIRTEMNNLTEQMERSSQYIRAGSEQIFETKNTFAVIRQQSGTVMKIGEQTKEESEQMVHLVRQIVDLFEQINQLSAEQSAISEQAAAETQQQLGSNESIVGLTQALTMQASLLQKLVEMFHVRDENA